MKYYLALISTLVLTACGGGGGGGSAPAVQPRILSAVQISSAVDQNTMLAYQTAATLEVPSDTCLVNATTVKYPAEYLGKYPVPAYSGSTALRNIPLGMNIVDNWAHGEGPNPNNEPGCRTDNRTEFINTLRRLRALGTSHVTIPLYVCINNADQPDQPWPKASISDSDLIWIAQQTQAQGMRTRLILQVCSNDENNPHRMLTNYVNRDWMEKFFASYKKFVLERAQVLDGYYEAMSVDWDDFNPNWTGLGDIRQRALTELTAELRKIWHGKLWLINLWGEWSNIATMTNQVDFVQIWLSHNLRFPASQQSSLTVADIQQGYTSIINSYKNQYRITVPVQYYIMAQSHSRFYEIGWVEDSGCWKHANPTMLCSGENGVTTDFGLQAMGIEGALRAISQQPANNIESVAIMGYRLGDNLQPGYSFPNTARSIRNKPAEYLVYQWWH